MTPDVPDRFGDGPGDAGDGGEDAVDGARGPGRSGSGWIPPIEDRLWRHPSEMRPLRPGGAGGAPTHPHRRRLRERRRMALAAVGTGAAAAAVAAGLVLLDTPGVVPDAQAHRPVNTEVTVSVTRSLVVAAPQSAAGTEQAMVMVTDQTSRGPVNSGGVAVAPGGLVATTADAVLGGSSLSVLTASGLRVRARLVAADRTSDVALIEVPTNLPVPRFVDETEIHTGSWAVAMSISAPQAIAAPADVLEVFPTVRPGIIETVDSPVPAGGAAGLAGIDAAMFTPLQTDGALLVRSDGGVLGMLDRSGTMAAGDGQAVFLPSDLVLGVASELRSTGRVRHGWLDVRGLDAAGGPGRTPEGALITRVFSRGAAHGMVEPGDVVVAMDGAPVTSMAQLRADIYLLAPGTAVDLTVVRHGQTAVVSVVLGRRP